MCCQPEVSSFRDLDIWQKSIQLVQLVVELTRSFPMQDADSMVLQIRRAALSIPASIAEGWERQKPEEFRQFLQIALGSLRELETCLFLSERDNYWDAGTIQPIHDLIQGLHEQILCLFQSLKRSLVKSREESDAE